MRCAALSVTTCGYGGNGDFLGGCSSYSAGTERWGSANGGPACGAARDAALGLQGLECEPEPLVVDLEACPEMDTAQGGLGRREFGEDEVLESGIVGRGGLLGELEMCTGAVGVGDETEVEGLCGRM